MLKVAGNAGRPKFRLAAVQRPRPMLFSIEWYSGLERVVSVKVGDAQSAISSVMRDLPGFSRRVGVTHALVKSVDGKVCFDSRNGAAAAP